MVQTIWRLVILQILRTTPFAPAQSPRKLFSKSFVFSQLLQYWFVCEVCNVFGIIERCRSSGTLICLFFIMRFAREYACIESRLNRSKTQEKLITTLPFKIHNRRKSASEHCSLLTAEERVTYALAAPAFPFVLRRPMSKADAREDVQLAPPPFRTNFFDPNLVVESLVRRPTWGMSSPSIEHFLG
jgi:hypothetical protein